MSQALLALSLPNEMDASLAKETSRLLAPLTRLAAPLSIRLLGTSNEETLRIPAPAVKMLVRILEEMALGNAVTLIPVHAELTTQEAADMLNISRPSLIHLLDAAQIEHRKARDHRRVRFESLMSYKRRADAERRSALAELGAYEQESGSDSWRLSSSFTTQTCFPSGASQRPHAPRADRTSAQSGLPMCMKNGSAVS